MLLTIFIVVVVVVVNHFELFAIYHRTFNTRRINQHVGWRHWELRQIHPGCFEISHVTVRRPSFTVPADHAFERFLDPVLEVHQYVVFIRKHDRSLIWGNVNVHEVFRHFEIQSAGWIVCVCRCRVVGAKRFIQSFRDFWIIHRTSVDVKELPICRSPRRSFLILETG